MEIADAIRSPDPTQFVSHQPVHQDGSCNGLQHYAALGHDSYGAKQVNLMPADRPQDVYEEVQQYENLFTTARKISQDNHSKFHYKSKIQIDAKNWAKNQNKQTKKQIEVSDSSLHITAAPSLLHSIMVLVYYIGERSRIEQLFKSIDEAI